MAFKLFRVGKPAIYLCRCRSTSSIIFIKYSSSTASPPPNAGHRASLHMVQVSPEVISDFVYVIPPDYHTLLRCQQGGARLFEAIRVFDLELEFCLSTKRGRARPRHLAANIVDARSINHSCSSVSHTRQQRSNKILISRLHFMLMLNSHILLVLPAAQRYTTQRQHQIPFSDRSDQVI